MSQSSLITPKYRQQSYKSPVISLSPQNSAEMTKFRGKGQIPRLGSKFRGPRNTVGLSDYLYRPVSVSVTLSDPLPGLFIIEH